MLNGKRILAVIPARGGSKRVPMKNMTIFKINGIYKSLVEWAIDHAMGSKHIDHWVLSTDDSSIGASALKHGNHHLLERPPYLAEDKSPTEGVMAHALYSMPGYDYAVLLQPTSPLRLPEDIDNCIEIAVNKHGENGLTGCVSYLEHRRNGAVYVCHAEHFLQMLSFDAAHHYQMPEERSLDIDHPWQFGKQWDHLRPGFPRDLA